MRARAALDVGLNLLLGLAVALAAVAAVDHFRGARLEVGRVRQSLIFGSKGLELFVCGDQLLKGAALNAVQIAEVMLEKGWLGQ